MVSGLSVTTTGDQLARQHWLQNIYQSWAILCPEVPTRVLREIELSFFRIVMSTSLLLTSRELAVALPEHGTGLVERVTAQLSSVRFEWVSSMHPNCKTKRSLSWQVKPVTSKIAKKRARSQQFPCRRLRIHAAARDLTLPKHTALQKRSYNAHHRSLVDYEMPYLNCVVENPLVRLIRETTVGFSSAEFQVHNDLITSLSLVFIWVTGRSTKFHKVVLMFWNSVFYRKISLRLVTNDPFGSRDDDENW